MNDIRQYSSDDILRDGGSIHVRAIRPDDKQRLREHSQGLSERSIYFRFLGPKKRLTDTYLSDPAVQEPAPESKPIRMVR